MNVVRYSDRPDLLARRFEELTKPTFPAYMNENEPGNLYWGRLYTDFPDFQVALIDGDDLLAEAHAVPLPWDGMLEDLPSGWDEGFVRGMTSDLPHTALMAIAISVAPTQQGRRLSRRMIETFTDNARAAGLANGVIAPVRPTWKDRYPLIPIEKYMEWTTKPFTVDSLRLANDPGRVIRTKDGRPRPTDGPYSEAKEILGGTYTIEAANYDEAVARTLDHPHLEYGGTIEVRQTFEM